MNQKERAVAVEDAEVVEEGMECPIPPEGRIEEVQVRTAEEQAARGVGGDLIPLAAAASEDQVERLVELMKARVRAWKRYRAAALSALNEADIVNMESDTQAEPRPYILGSGCRKVYDQFSIEIERPKPGTEDLAGFKKVVLDDGTYMYLRAARARCLALSDNWVDVVGSRWSGDGFFQHPDKQNPGRFLPIDPGDVLKSALTNFHGEVARQLLGLDSITMGELKDAGIDWSKVRSVAYASTRKPTVQAEWEHDTSLCHAGKQGGEWYDVLEVSCTEGSSDKGKYVRIVATLAGPQGKFQASTFDTAIGDVLLNASTRGVRAQVAIATKGKFQNIEGATIKPEGNGEEKAS
jgi:hypothetical protein